MSDRPQSYVGVSGVSTPEQAHAILDMWPASTPPQSLMLGVLTSQKVLGGGERNARSPAPEAFERIFRDDPRVLNLIHYFTKDTATLGNQLLGAAAYGGVGCHGVQVNVPWPSPEQLMVFRDFGDYERVVLQIGPKALAQAEHKVTMFGALDAYGESITDVLIDVSAGEGIPINPTWAREIVQTIRAWTPGIGIGIAGRLCARTLHGVADLVREYDLSTDTETAVRNDADELDLGEVHAYLGAAAKIRGWA